MIQNGKCDLPYMLIKFLYIYRREKVLIHYDLTSIMNLLLLDEEFDIFTDSNYSVRITFLKYGLEDLLVNELQYYEYEEVQTVTQKILEFLKDAADGEMRISN